ncbi:hypothetical protein H7827_11025 [Streptomyces sp. JH002]|uniref:hypothetical protein n=1 Tax=Streptomyces TaxID=1883 RepID=UPI0036C24628
MSTPPPPRLPGRIRTARALSYTVAGVTLLMALISLRAGFGDEKTLRELDLTAGPVITLGVIFLAFGAVGIALATRFARGGARVRIGAMAWGVAGVLLGFGTGTLGLLVLAASVVLVALLAMRDSRDWFAKPQD